MTGLLKKPNILSDFRGGYELWDYIIGVVVYDNLGFIPKRGW